MFIFCEESGRISHQFVKISFHFFISEFCPTPPFPSIFFRQPPSPPPSSHFFWRGPPSNPTSPPYPIKNERSLKRNSFVAFYKSLQVAFYKSPFYKSSFCKSSFYKSAFCKSMFYKSSFCKYSPVQSNPRNTVCGKILEFMAGGEITQDKSYDGRGGDEPTKPICSTKTFLEGRFTFLSLLLLTGEHYVAHNDYFLYSLNNICLGNELSL